MKSLFILFLNVIFACFSLFFQRFYTFTAARQPDNVEFEQARRRFEILAADVNQKMLMLKRLKKIERNTVTDCGFHDQVPTSSSADIWSELEDISSRTPFNSWSARTARRFRNLLLSWLASRNATRPLEVSSMTLGDFTNRKGVSNGLSISVRL